MLANVLPGTLRQPSGSSGRGNDTVRIGAVSILIRKLEALALGCLIGGSPSAPDCLDPDFPIAAILCYANVPEQDVKWEPAVFEQVCNEPFIFQIVCSTNLIIFPYMLNVVAAHILPFSVILKVK